MYLHVGLLHVGGTIVRRRLLPPPSCRTTTRRRGRFLRTASIFHDDEAESHYLQRTQARNLLANPSVLALFGVGAPLNLSGHGALPPSPRRHYTYVGIPIRKFDYRVSNE